jgi:peptidoglycan/xylan/chitin deacetylase (PgdA/CDA1 family)
MTASVTLSLELELAWGQHDKGGSKIYSSDRSAEEHYLEKLLEACDQYDVPITFDVVGHLLLESCNGTHDGMHDDNWFAADPGTDADSDPLFYWPELPTLLNRRAVDHELATHTFSHVLCDEIDEQTLIWELKRCFETHQKAGLNRPETIVTPRHRPISYDALQDVEIDGIRTLKRHPRESTFDRYKQRATFWTLNRGHPAYEPTCRNGIVELYTTPYPSLTAVHLPNGQLSPLWPFQRVPRHIRQRIQQRYLNNAIETAIETNSNVHLWTHLYNLSNDAQWACIEPFLKRLGEAQKNGAVDVLTMADLVERNRV